MVAQVGSLSRNGLLDFVFQRLSAYILTLYTAFIVGFFLFTKPDYEELAALFAATPFKWVTLLAVLSVAVHAWIGTWIIGTDYIRPFSFGRFAAPLRGLYQLGCVSLNFVYVAWCIHILWSL